MYLMKGRLAQLVERLPYKQVVTGSNPVPPKLFIKFSKFPGNRLEGITPLTYFSDRAHRLRD